LSKTWKSLKHLKNSSIPSNPDRAHIYTISGAIQANYEILESLSRDRRRQIHNEDLRTELEYFSEDYDEELKMEPRPKRTREVTPPLRTRSPRVRRQREKGSVTPFVRWIKEYHLPDGLKMPSHVGCYDEKGDTDNFLHLLEGTIQGELRVSEFCTRLLDDTLQILGLHEDQRISGFVHGLKARNLVEHLSTNLPSTNKGLMENTYTWIKAREVATNELRKVEEILLGQGQGTEKQRQLRSQIEEVVRSGQLSHLVKGIKKERTKTSNSHRGEKKEKSTTPAEAPILMINQEEARIRNNLSKSPTFEGREITFPLVTKGSNSSAPVIIKAKIFEREVGQVHMDSGSSCEVIYEPCFLKLKPSNQSSKVDLQVLLVGFSGEKS
ncbi:hypothetical protein Tco_1048915, partial [Tanacetum coccineum]